MPAYTPIRDIPQTGLSEWEWALLGAMKENLELLMGVRVSGTQAITSDQITTAQADNQTMKQVSAIGSGFTVSGVDVAGLEDYQKLVLDVQALANDVARIQFVLNNLLGILRAGR
jgi:hypothetical protein